MALAQHIKIQSDRRVSHHFLSQISQTVTVLCKRLWWHSKAYTTVFGIMFLGLASLGFLSIHWSGKKITKFFENGTVVEQE
jgi:hypothetical protein